MTAKLFLLFYIWGLIALFILVILKSRQFYFALKAFEKVCVHKKKEVTHNFLPLVLGLDKKNQSLKTVLNLNKSNFKDLFFLLFPMLFQGFLFYQWVRTGFKLTRNVLR